MERNGEEWKGTERNGFVINDSENMNKKTSKKNIELLTKELKHINKLQQAISHLIKLLKKNNRLIEG